MAGAKETKNISQRQMRKVCAAERGFKGSNMITEVLKEEEKDENRDSEPGNAWPKT
jgi:hypothetical protein